MRKNEKSSVTYKVDVLLGLQWGDEGKGKVIDLLLPKYDIVARFGGGANAGHSLKHDGREFIGHLIPSGVFGKQILLQGPGMVIDPIQQMCEIDTLLAMDIDIRERLFISDRATLVNPFHSILDKAEEHRKKNGNIGIVGTTGRGIGPAYADSRSRTACKVGDIFTPDFEKNLCAFQIELLEWYQKTYHFKLAEFDLDLIKSDWLKSVSRMREELQICDMTEKVQDLISSGKRILAEGAQGVMLDVDHGDYPNVTSSTTLPCGVCSGLGIPHTLIGDVIGILKLYPTKVGGGAFPSRFSKEVEDTWRNAGNEYGATTKRPRMCGMLDLPALKYAMHLSGVNKLFIAKADICPTEDFLIVTDYLCNWEKVKSFPRQLKIVDDVEIMKMKGWPKITPGIKDVTLLPKELINLLNFLELQFKAWGFKVSIDWIGTGPDRSDVVSLRSLVSV